MLDEFIAANRSEIITRCRAKVETRSEPSPAGADADRGVPMFLDQLLAELRDGPSAASDIASTAMQHGHDLLLRGYTVSEVVHDYGDVCQAVTELAVERKAVISTDDFRTLNRCLDDAIAGAVTEYGRERDQSGERNDSIDARGGGAWPVTSGRRFRSRRPRSRRSNPGRWGLPAVPGQSSVWVSRPPANSPNDCSLKALGGARRLARTVCP